MKKVLFVCLGNICRSPAAEAVMKSKLDQLGLIDELEVDSAGILDTHQGEPADKRMQEHGLKRGYDINSISRPVVIDDFLKFDHIIAMDSRNKQDLLELCPRPELAEKIQLMCEFLKSKDYEEVPDPYFGGDEGFELVLDLLEESISNFIHEISK